MASSDSTAPFGDPGRFTIKTLPRVPATPRESAASGVERRPVARITSAKQGISRSITDRVASGVTSRKAIPVPPVVKTADTRPESARSARRPPIAAASSGRTSSTETRQPSCSSRSRTAGPEMSERVPLCAESLMVSTAASIIRSALASGLFEQVHILNLDGFIESLRHVVYGQGGDRGSGKCLHFDTGLTCGRHGGRDTYTARLDAGFDVGMRQHQRMTQRDQLRSLLRGRDSGKSGDLQRIALWILRQLAEHRRTDTDEGVRACLAPRRRLIRHVHHPCAASGIVVREFL